MLARAAAQRTPDAAGIETIVQDAKTNEAKAPALPRSPRADATIPAVTAAELQDQLRGALNPHSFEAVKTYLQRLDPMSTGAVPAEALAGGLQRLLPHGDVLTGPNVV